MTSSTAIIIIVVVVVVVVAVVFIVVVLLLLYENIHFVHPFATLSEDRILGRVTTQKIYNWCQRCAYNPIHRESMRGYGEAFVKSVEQRGTKREIKLLMARGKAKEWTRCKKRKRLRLVVLRQAYNEIKSVMAPTEKVSDVAKYIYIYRREIYRKYIYYIKEGWRLGPEWTAHSNTPLQATSTTTLLALTHHKTILHFKVRREVTTPTVAMEHSAVNLRTSVFARTG